MFDTDSSGSLDTREIIELIKAVYGYSAFEENKRVKSILGKLDANGGELFLPSFSCSFPSSIYFPFWYCLSFRYFRQFLLRLPLVPSVGFFLSLRPLEHNFKFLRPSVPSFL
jgi:hypothetical protein